MNLELNVRKVIASYGNKCDLNDILETIQKFYVEK
jgi:hypothetical protein